MDTKKTDKNVDQSVVTADTGVMRTFSDKKSGKNMNMKIVTVLFIVVLLGLGSGYLLASKNGALDSSGGKVSLLGAEKGKIFGTESIEGYDDPAEGVVKKGGIDGEGAYHMERPGGETQTVYLTSSSVDLGQFVNKKVRVWGKSQDAQKAGWLLDVGRLEVL